MTTKYIVKKCLSFGYARTLKTAITLFTPEELRNNPIQFIHDEDTVCPTNWKSITKIEDMDTESGIIFVELAKRKKITEMVPIASDNDVNIINELDYTGLSCQDILDQLKDAFIEIIHDHDVLNEKELTNNFLEYILFVFPHIEDSGLRASLLKILNFNKIQTIDLEKDNPVKKEEVEIDAVIPIPLFEDIRIVGDKKDKNLTNKLYKCDRDAIKHAAIGNSTQLEAFSTNKFTVIHGAKDSGINSDIYNQNHDVLDSLARNGVVRSPDLPHLLSINELINKLKQFKSFHIVFIHPSYELRATRSEYPGELIEPAYYINEGELLPVVYRYLVTNFFGYCSVINDNTREQAYLI